MSRIQEQLLRDRKQRQEESRNLRRGQEVTTPDGEGKIIAHELRQNTNGGPGTWQYRVRLFDGRVRHYNKQSLTPKKKS